MKEKHWLVLNIGNNWQAIMPNNDTEPHAKVVLIWPDGRKQAEIASGDCPCKPALDFKDRLVIHNSFDKREEYERGDKAENS